LLRRAFPSLFRRERETRAQKPAVVRWMMDALVDAAMREGVAR
jgi:hypothetical protein